MALTPRTTDSGIVKDGTASFQSNSTNEISVLAPISAEATHGGDFRVRLKAMRNQEEQVYGPNTPDNILSPLFATDGMLFPYTPSVQFNQDVDYKSLELVHANGEQYAYSRTPSVSLSVTGKFAIQNPAEGRYVMAAVHFLRVASKMWFGANTYSAATDTTSSNTGNSGLPPPILIFNGFGAYMFNDLKVILRNHSYSIDDTSQLVRISIGTQYVYLPSLFSISLNLTVINTPTELLGDVGAKSGFNLDRFRDGSLMKEGGWI